MLLFFKHCFQQRYRFKTVIKLRSVLRTVLKTIYYALVNSKLQYGLACWGGAFYSTLKPLVIAQKKVIRIMLLKGGREESFPLYIQLQILPLRYLYVYRVMQIYNLRGGNVACNIKEYDMRLRDYEVAAVPRPFFETHKRSFDYLAPKLWNKIRPSAETMNSPRTFKKYLKTYAFTINDMENWLLSLG